MGNVYCPACTRVIQLPKEIKVQDLINCPHCSSMLEYVSQDPPNLDWAEDPQVYPSHRLLKQNY